MNTNHTGLTSQWYLPEKEQLQQNAKYEMLIRDLLFRFTDKIFIHFKIF